MTRHPHRLQSEDLAGTQRYFLTICTFDRRPYFQDPDIVDLAHVQFLHSCGIKEFDLLAYCFMPDHVHLVAEGLGAGSSFSEFVRLAKQLSGYEFHRRTRLKLWQPSYFDRTIRADEATIDVIRYVINNPLRAGLVTNLADYPHWGSGCCSREELLDWIGATSVSRV